MTLSDDVKAKIQAEYDAWQEQQYAGKDKKARQAKGQFFTPPALTIKMLEKFESLSGTVLDPCLGAGGLIAAAVLAGADPTQCYGIELDPEILEVAKARLSALGVPERNLKCGDALDSQSYAFGEEAVEAAPKKLAEPKKPVVKPPAPKPALLVECADAESINGRTFEQLLEGNESLSAAKVWRMWAEEAKHAYARYNAWKVGKPKDEAKAVHAAYRQWKIDQEAKWCMHFNAKNPNDRKRQTS